MTKQVPIRMIEGVELLPADSAGVSRGRVLDAEAKKALSWDRYVRLKAAANAISNLSLQDRTILDVGGYDGALALFLPEFELDLVDPATTGVSFLHAQIAAESYEVVTAIDVLEHIVPTERSRALTAICRVARKYVVLNYPCQQSKQAQELVLKATNNPLIREHVQWELPDSDWVLATVANLGFRGYAMPHTNLAVWLGQYLTLNLVPEAAPALNRYLIESHHEEPFSVPLYHLVVCERDR